MGFLEDFYVENSKAVLVSSHLKTDKSSPRGYFYLRNLCNQGLTPTQLLSPKQTLVIINHAIIAKR